MKKDFTHYHETILERVDRDIPAEVEVHWFWDEGEPVGDTGRRVNRGWYGEVVARDPETRRVLELTERETEIILEDCHPDALEMTEDFE